MNDHEESISDKQAADAVVLEKVGSVKWYKILKVFLVRVPLWVFVLIAVVIGAWMGYNSFTEEDPVNLRPAVRDAKELTVTIATCDEQIDAHGIDIRKEELRLIDQFKEVENVKKVTVRIDRKDKLCVASSK